MAKMYSTDNVQLLVKRCIYVKAKEHQISSYNREALRARAEAAVALPMGLVGGVIVGGLVGEDYLDVGDARASCVSDTVVNTII